MFLDGELGGGFREWELDSGLVWRLVPVRIREWRLDSGLVWRLVRVRQWC